MSYRADFFPHHALSVRKKGGLQIPKPTEVNSTDRFQPLFVRMALKCPIPIPQEWKKVPYDMYCPSLSKVVISSRMCSTCGQYFASKKAAETHAKGVHFVKSAANTKNNSSKIRLARVSARRRGTESFLPSFSAMFKMIVLVRLNVNGSRKPISTCAMCQLSHQSLTLLSFVPLQSGLQAISLLMKSRFYFMFCFLL